jgi:DNA topoisomerase-1
MKLIIVESPGKIKKINSILNKDYLIKASVGHIRNLDKKGLSYNEETFVAEYKILPDKIEVVKNLKDAVSKCSIIYLASDPDREGEAISQALKDVLKLKEYKRITFNSITASAVKDAIDNPRLIDDQLVEAQETRMILDKMIGYKISPVLMKKYEMSNLSAGRVQSVVVRIMVDLENEINNFIPDAEFNGHAETTLNSKKIKLTLYYKNKLFRGSESDARKILEKLKSSKYTLAELNEKFREQNPPPPFITSTLQQEASNKLKYDLQRTMKEAQSLYESGKITYMRTDSPSISKEAINPIKDVIKDKFTEASFKYREYKSKNASAQEAHECIRPTHPEVDNDNTLYNLIWKRTIASLMIPAKYQVFQITVNTDDPNITFKGEVERLDTPGFLQVYGQVADEAITLSGEKKTLKLSGICMEEKISSPPSRYGEASLVKDLEKLEIGRPSTYANLIAKIKDRGYVEEKDHDGKTYDQKILKLEKTEIKEENNQIVLGKEKKRLTPTTLGINITKVLIDMFANFMDVNFTAQTEAVLDDIANGKKKKLPVLTEYWNLLKNYLDKLSSYVVTKNNIDLGEYNNGNISLVTARYGEVIKYTKGKDILYVNITDKNLTLDDAIQKIKDKLEGKLESGTLIGSEGTYKYYQTTAKFGPVIKQIDSNGKVDYRNIKNYKKEINMTLVKKVFSYPITLSKTVSLNYNLIKDSYYLKDATKFVSFPKENLEMSKADMIKYYEENKDAVKAKPKPKFIKKT